MRTPISSRMHRYTNPPAYIYPCVRTSKRAKTCHHNTATMATITTTTTTATTTYHHRLLPPITTGCNHLALPEQPQSPPTTAITTDHYNYNRKILCRYSQLMHWYTFMTCLFLSLSHTHTHVLALAHWLPQAGVERPITPIQVPSICWCRGRSDGGSSHHARRSSVASTSLRGLRRTCRNCGRRTGH